MDSIGYKSIPITMNTQRGPLSGALGITYVREGTQLIVCDYWLNPGLKERMDHVDQMRFVSLGMSRFHATIGPFIGSRQWEGVVYG